MALCELSMAHVNMKWARERDKNRSQCRSVDKIGVCHIRECLLFEDVFFSNEIMARKQKEIQEIRNQNLCWIEPKNENEKIQRIMSVFLVFLAGYVRKLNENGHNKRQPQHNHKIAFIQDLHCQCYGIIDFLTYFVTEISTCTLIALPCLAFTPRPSVNLHPETKWHKNSSSSALLTAPI